MPSSFPLQQHLRGASRLVLGCMGLGGGWDEAPLQASEVDRAQRLVETALEAGITLFDHADIYTRGKAEQAFGELFRRSPGLRAQLLLQSKCAIRFADDQGPGRYDWSAAYIERAVEASLRRLNTDHLDILLLHRPDPLMQAEEVAAAFGRLQASGKVQHFGVSNLHGPGLQALRRALPMPLLVNQLEMSLAKRDWLDATTTFNSDQQAGSAAWAGLLDGSVQLQAWGALAKGAFEQPGTPGAAELAAIAERLAEPREAVLLAWLLRHPAGMQPVIGTTNPARIRACARATQVELSRDDWYRLYVAARGQPLP